MAHKERQTDRQTDGDRHGQRQTQRECTFSRAARADLQDGVCQILPFVSHRAAPVRSVQTSSLLADLQLSLVIVERSGKDLWLWKEEEEDDDGYAVG